LFAVDLEEESDPALYKTLRHIKRAITRIYRAVKKPQKVVWIIVQQATRFL
jgi:hypothetical protein